MTEVKICGVTSPDVLDAAAQSGARFIGFVFAPKSPRFIAVEQAAILARRVPTGVKTVGLFVDPDDDTLKRVTERVPLDMIQLHGKESPTRIQYIKQHYQLPIIKSIPIADKTDLGQLQFIEPLVDWILFDAKATGQAMQEGGNGVSFDWNILKNYHGKKPWMLAGGLTPENVKDALAQLSPEAVDVSSGVESAVGIKDIQKIRSFIQAVRNIS